MCPGFLVMDPEGYGVYSFRLTGSYRQRLGQWSVEYTFPSQARCEEARRAVESALAAGGDDKIAAQLTECR